jgi:hypothetical protein
VFCHHESHDTNHVISFHKFEIKESLSTDFTITPYLSSLSVGSSSPSTPQLKNENEMRLAIWEIDRDRAPVRDPALV